MKEILILFLIWCFSENALSQAYITDDGSIKFISRAPLNEFDGNSSYLNGLIDLDKNLVDFYIDLNTIKTGISLRDSHMRDSYLETNDYPYAEFTGTIENIEQINKQTLQRGLEVVAKGDFTIHGEKQQKEINGRLKLNDEGKLILEAKFKVALKDHNIEKPSLLGYELADVQDVEIKAILNEK